MKKYFYLILFGTLVVIATVFVLVSDPSVPRETPAPAIVATSSSAEVKQLPPPSSVNAEAYATLLVGDASYAVPQGTVLEAMEALKASGSFTYMSREYPGLGVFVESINGKRGEGGRYWILYVNGESATQGAGLVEIREGDRIEWKYEKGY